MKVHLAISCLFAFMMINMGVEAIRKLSCSSTLRSQFPHLFTHCKDECIYGPWSSWTYETYKYNDNSVLNCFNKIAYKYKRTRVVLSDKGSCDEMVTVDFKHECPPTLYDHVHIFAKELKLGSNARNMTLYTPSISVSQVTGQAIQARCVNRKYEKREVEMNSVAETSDNVQRDQCESRNVLLMLDVSVRDYRSDRIGRMKELLATIATHICGPINVAMMTFEGGRNAVKFCFNENSNRQQLGQRIRRVGYIQGGISNAFKCAYEDVISPECGLLPNAPLEVIILTNGLQHPQNPWLSKLRNRANTKIWGIGIEPYSYPDAKINAETWSALRDQSRTKSGHPNIFQIRRWPNLQMFTRILKEYLNSGSSYGYTCDC